MSCSRTPHGKHKSPSVDTFKCKKIGNYVLSNTIGKGTFSKVKLGIHLITQQKVAIKILDREKIVDENDLERISREIHILKALRHPNITQLYETITSEKHIYIIMEFIEGKDLFQFIYSKTRLSESKTSELFKQLISALEYIHTLGVVHRDIKPENILLNQSKTIIKLVDFGLSNSYKHGDFLITACGSPCYASPEMISGKEYDGFYSDLWSCGVVLYCMLVGNLPFDDEDIEVLYRKIRSADYLMPDYLSPIAQDLLHKILETDPNKRITLDDLKQHPFFTLAQKELQLAKGILIGIEPIPVDIQLVSLIKKKYYSDKEKITEAYIKDCISQNNHNNLTVLYYLLLKQKIEEKQSDSNNNNKENAPLLSITSNERKRCDNMFNLHTIKKINFTKKKKRDFSNQLNQNRVGLNLNLNSNAHSHNININTTSNNINNNTNNNNSRYVNKINSGNNQVNVVVINNIVTESSNLQKQKAKSLSKKEKTNQLLLNINNNTKMNTTTTFNNNVLTTKINFNEMISNQIAKQNQNSRNINAEALVKRNKTVSSLNYNHHPLSLNLNSTLSNQLRGILSKSKGTNHCINKKYVFNSPNNSTDNFNVKKIVISKEINNKSKPKNEIKVKNGNNKLLIKRIFDNESFNCENPNATLNITNYFSNTHKKVFSKEKNKLNQLVKDKDKDKEKVMSNVKPNLSKNKTNITGGQPHAPNLKLFQYNSKMLNAKNAPSFMRNNFSLNKSNSRSKEKTYGKVITEKSLSKDKTRPLPFNLSKGKQTKKNTSKEKKGDNIVFGYSKEKKSFSLTKKIPNSLKNKSLENTLFKLKIKK